jgi:hypothetical protein
MTAEVEFLLTAEWQGVALTEAADFNGYPVYLQRSDWGDDLTAQIERNLSVFDNAIGAVHFNDVAGVHRFNRQYRLVLGTRAEIDHFKKWLAARAGRLNPFYLPSNSNDFTVQNAIADDETFISVANAGHAFVAGEIGRRDIVIELNNGTRYYRTIIAADAINASTETITINTALGVDVAPSDIRCVSYLRLMRLASDGVEVAYKTDGVATVALGFVSVRELNDE